MKKYIIVGLLSLFFMNGFSQDLNFEVRGKYQRPVKKEKLQEARFVSDFVPGYPASWVSQYVSVEILVTSNGNTQKAVNENDLLSTAQKNLLNKAEPSSDIVIKVFYKHKNAVTGKMGINQMHILLTVVPEKEAEYIGGYAELKKYLKVNSINKMAEPSIFGRLPTVAANQQAKVLFTINEQGEIINAKISQTSGSKRTDQLMLDAIHKMPKWKPAENAKGIKVKQEFEFIVGNGGC